MQRPEAPAPVEVPRTHGTTPLLTGMRMLLVVAGVLVFLAGVQLFVFPDRTAERFAWTIDPPMTALFLGAAYWSALALEVSAARSRTWAGARIAVPAVFTFTTTTLVVTLLHLDRFHLGAEHTGATRAVTWAWIAIYATVPVMMAAAWIAQRRVAGEDPPRTARLSGPVRATVAVLVAILAVVGTVALLVPDTAARWWAWPLTPLTARAIGAWAIGLAVAGAHALLEDDVERVRPAAWAFVSFAALEALALVRGRRDVDWSDPSAAVLVAVLVVAVAVGATVLAGTGTGSARAAGSEGSAQARAPNRWSTRSADEGRRVRRPG